MDSNSAKASSVSPLEDILERLAKVQEEISQLVKALDMKLSPVMREPSTENPVSEREKEKDAVSPMTSVLRTRCNDAEVILQRLTAIMRRLEV